MRDQLDLKRLPRVEASDGFTAEVLRRVRSDANRQATPGLRLALAAAAVVVVSAGAGAWWARQSAPEPVPITTESIEQLRSAYQELNREFESLSRLADDTQPFVPVSINPQTEVLFDLRDIEPLPVSFASVGSRRIQ
ncbi:MAG: hypothetical protein OXG83_11840 [Acidobacteria bacterium]|nr:hypothetical protein [Acidobacteriota bacterium]